MLNFSFDFCARNKADDVIDGLIDKVLEVYPPERLKRIKERTAHSWKDRNYGGSPYGDRIAYVMLDPKQLEEPKIPEDASEYQAAMIRQLKFMLNNSVVDCEYYPAFNPSGNQVTIPSLFGCVNESISGSEHVKPIIRSPSDVYSLRDAEPREGYTCYEVLRKMAYMHQRAGGRIPVYMTDIQGPFSSAAQMWGIQDFLCDMREYPNEAHYLLSLCTEAIIRYFHAMYRVTEGNLNPIHCLPVIYIPEDCGVAVSDDFLAIVSAGDSGEFSVPYLEKIGEAFGGITTHSCGCMNHQVGLMNSMKNLKCLNFSASETDLRKYAKEHDPKAVLFVHKNVVSINNLPLLNAEEHIRLCKNVQKECGVNVIAYALHSDEPLSEVNRIKWLEASKL